MFNVGDEFDDLSVAKKTITKSLTDNWESYYVSHSNKKRFVLTYKANKEICDFYVCVSTSIAKSKGFKTAI
jgi:hypothetical protein